MGKSVPKLIKAKAAELVELLPDLTTDFDANKQKIKALGLPYSKKQINIIAGYITRLKKKELKEK
jgi:ribosomal protein S17E